MAQPPLDFDAAARRAEKIFNQGKGDGADVANLAKFVSQLLAEVKSLKQKQADLEHEVRQLRAR